MCNQAGVIMNQVSSTTNLKLNSLNSDQLTNHCQPCKTNIDFHIPKSCPNWFSLYIYNKVEQDVKYIENWNHIEWQLQIYNKLRSIEAVLPTQLECVQKGCGWSRGWTGRFKELSWGGCAIWEVGILGVAALRDGCATRYCL